MAKPVQFDINAKENQPYRDFLSVRRAVILDPTTSASRQTIRKLLSSLGVKNPNIEVCETYEEAEARVIETKPQIIFTEYSCGQRCGIDLLQIQRKHYPSPLETGFFLTSDKGSPAIASHVAEEDADALILRPFTYGILQDHFVQAIKGKISPDAFAYAIENGKRHLASGKVDDAIRTFREALALNPMPVQAICYLGIAHRQKGDNVAAKRFFEEALSFDLKHYRSLMGLFEIHSEAKEFERAYVHMRTLADNYPINPKRIPEFIRASIANKKFTDIMQFYEAFADMVEVDAVMGLTVSAALVICGKFLLQQGRTADGIASLRKANASCRGRPKIIGEIARAYLSVGLAAEAKSLLASIPIETQDLPEFRLLQLEIAHLTASPMDTMKMAYDLVKAGLKEARIYEILILQSVGLKRKPKLILDLIEQAALAFPDRAKHFESLCPTEETTG